MQHLIALTAAVCSVEMDLRTMKISNRFLEIMLICSLLAAFSGGRQGMMTFFGGAAASLLLTGWLFLFRLMGAGDIKLLAVLGSLMGAGEILLCIFWSFVFGAVFAVGIIYNRGIARERARYFGEYVRQCLQKKTRISYRREGMHPENMHFTVPVLMSVLLWIGGFY